MKSYIPFFSIPFLFIFIGFAPIEKIYADHLISFFLRPYPVIDQKAASKKIANKLHRPGKIISNHTKRIIPPKLSGIFATYGGFLTTSNLDGEISFPLKHENPGVYVLVTEKITPIVMSANTLHHWELIEDTPSKFYLFERRYDPTTQVYYWDVSAQPLPKNNIIPLETMVLFANPKYVFIPLGITPVAPDPNLLLPDIYIKNGLNIALDSLYVLNLSHYFGPIFFLYQKDTKRYSSHLTY